MNSVYEMPIDPATDAPVKAPPCKCKKKTVKKRKTIIKRCLVIVTAIIVLVTDGAGMGLGLYAKFRIDVIDGEKRTDIPTSISPETITATASTEQQDTTTDMVAVCNAPNKWTFWIDRDNPSGEGDYETLVELRNENPWLCAHPTEVDAALVNGSENYLLGGNNVDIGKDLGFYCVNSQQPTGTYCKDYKVRFCCPDIPTFISPETITATASTEQQDTTTDIVTVCNAPNKWTPWLDRDNPSGKGDYETLVELRNENPWLCAHPTEVDAALVNGENYLLGGNNVDIGKDIGFYCVNSQQPTGTYCKDYKVRFCCPDPGSIVTATDTLQHQLFSPILPVAEDALIANMSSSHSSS